MFVEVGGMKKINTNLTGYHVWQFFLISVIYFDNIIQRGTLGWYKS